MITDSFLRNLTVLYVSAALLIGCHPVSEGDSETAYFRNIAEEQIKFEILQLLYDMQPQQVDYDAFSTRGNSIGDSVHQLSMKFIHEVPKFGKMPDCKIRNQNINALLDKSALRPYDKMQLRKQIWMDIDATSATTDRQTIVYQYLYAELLILRKLHTRYGSAIQHENIFHTGENNTIIVRINTPEMLVFPLSDSLVVAGCLYNSMVLPPSSAEIIIDKEICVGIVHLPEGVTVTPHDELILYLKLKAQNWRQNQDYTYTFHPARYDYSTGALLN